MDTGILNVIVLRMEAGENPALPRNCKQLRKPQTSHFSNIDWEGAASRVKLQSQETCPWKPSREGQA